MTTDSLSQIGYFVKDWAILVNGQLTILPSGQTAAGRTGFIRQANSARHPVSPAAQCFSAPITSGVRFRQKTVGTGRSPCQKNEKLTCSLGAALV
jgi:hypothetical protein